MENVSVEQTVISTVTVAAMSTALYNQERVGILVSHHAAWITLVLDVVMSTSEMLKTIDVHAMYLAIREVIAVQMHCHSVFLRHVVMLESMLVAVCGAQLSHVLFLEVDAIVTAIAPITMIAAQMFHLLLATNTVLILFS